MEAVKDRLYNPRLARLSQKSCRSIHAVRGALSDMQLLAPVTPHLTEEIYSTHVQMKAKGFESLQVSTWPNFNAAHLSMRTAETHGDLIIALIGEVRHDKAEKKLPLNAPMKKLDHLCRHRSKCESVLFSQW